MISRSFIFIAVLLAHFSVAQDMPLSQVLIEGEGWQVVSEGHGMTDGLCTDDEGNLYFTDVRSGMAIYKIDLEGKRSEFVNEIQGVSGLQWGADGQLYACVARGRRVVSFSKAGEMKVLATEIRPNDLVVTHDGNLYFTMTPTSEIRRISPDGKMSVVSAGVVTKPNGITLSPDQETLAVSDHGGKFVWTFKIADDGSLKSPEGKMTMRTPETDPDVAKGDGMATDVHGRYYVTTAEGLQVFDPTGRLGGVIAKPQNANLVSACFAGPNHEFLYVACGDKIFRRKTKTQGALFFREPHANRKFKAAVEDKPKKVPPIYANDFKNDGNAYDPKDEKNECFEFGAEASAFFIDDITLPTEKGVTLKFNVFAVEGNLDLENHKGTGLLQIDVYDAEKTSRVIFQPTFKANQEWQALSVPIQLERDASRIIIYNKWNTDVPIFIDNVEIFATDSETKQQG